MFDKEYSNIFADISKRTTRLGKEYFEKNEDLIKEYILKIPIPSYVEAPRNSPLQILDVSYNGYNSGIFTFFVKCSCGNSIGYYAAYISMDEIELYKRTK